MEDKVRSFRAFFHKYVHTGLASVYCDGIFLGTEYVYNLARTNELMTKYRVSKTPEIHPTRFYEDRVKYNYLPIYPEMLVLVPVPCGRTKYRWQLRYYVNAILISEFTFLEVYTKVPNTTTEVKDAHKLTRCLRGACESFMRRLYEHSTRT